MQAIPRQLASRLDEGSIRFHAPVQHVWEGGVRLESGEELQAGMVVVACDPVHAARLLPEAGIRTAMRGVECLYFAAADAPIGDRYLVLNGEGNGPINNLCVPSVIAPGLCPAGSSPGVGHGPTSRGQPGPTATRCAPTTARLVWREGERMGIPAVVPH